MASDELIQEIFGDDDSDAEFDFFTAEDLNEVNISMDFEIPDFDDDQDFGNDIGLGWLRNSAEPPLVPPFTGNHGVNVLINSTSCIDYLRLFLTDPDFENMSTETNRYFSQNYDHNNLSKYARLRNWQNTTPGEMKKWMGLIIATGLVDKPFLEKYWSTDSIIHTPLFGNTMPRDRFLNILCCFHLNDNTKAFARGDDNYDPLFKIRPLYDAARDVFAQVYTPEQHLALDEGMVPWKGRLSFKVYIPNKPDKFGMKLYILCESMSGYICTFDVYTGKNYDPNPDDNTTHGHSYDVVMGTMRKLDLLNKGYCVYTDNYYSSPTLFDDLNAEGTLAVGTVRLNRKEMPTALKVTKLKKGEAIFRQRGNLTAIKWKDKRDVSVLSTIHTGSFYITNRTERATGDPIVIPTCILDYNKHMGGVDRADQLAKYYTITRKSFKWWKKLAMHVINMMITNAYILYKKMVPKALSQYDFRKEVARDLISAHAAIQCRKGRRIVGAPERRLIERHFPSAIPSQEGAKKKNPSRKCVVCNTNTGKRNAAGQPRKRKETRYWCADCCAALCIDDCFKRYHTLKNYKLHEDSDSSSDSRDD